MTKMMKVRLLALACAALLVSTSVFAQNHVRGQLKVGAAKVDVTPGPDQLGRNTYGVLDHTHFRVILFTNGTNIAGLANIDGNANQRCVDAVNERIEKEFGFETNVTLDAGDISLEIGLVMLDDIPICAVSGEPYNQIAVDLKNKSPYNFTIMTTVTDGHNKGRGGYIPYNSWEP